MNVLQKCCFRSLKENRKRTGVTIIGIILATALITGVACLVVSFRDSVVAYEKEQNGDFHYLFSGVKAENLRFFNNNRHIRKMALTEQIGYALLEGSQNPDKPYLYIRAVDEQGMETLSLKLSSGRMPENASELVIGRHIGSNGLVDLAVGDVLTLKVGERVSAGATLDQSYPYTYEQETLETYETRTYTVVGIIDRPNDTVEERMAPGYSVFTYLDHSLDHSLDDRLQDSLKDKLDDSLADRSADAKGEAEHTGIWDVYVTYTNWGLKHADQVNAGILGVPEELYLRFHGFFYGGDGDFTEAEALQIRQVAENVKENYWLNKWLLFSFSSRTLNMLYAMAAVAVGVIMFTSVFCIRNSFMISLTEKMKLYGRLASVGTTSGQLRKIVYYEAGLLGIVGIPLGILGGIGGTFLLVRVVSDMVESAMDIPLIFGISLWAILAAVLLSGVTIFCSGLQAARRAAKISPINAIRANDTVKIRGKELKCPVYIRRWFGVGGRIAYKNLRRARVKYRATVVSIVVSVVVFIGMTTFVQSSLAATGLYYHDRRYQIWVSLYDEDAYEQAKRMVELAGVQEAEIVRNGVMTVDADTLSYTEEYLREWPDASSRSEIIWFRSIGDAAYERFCKEVGVSPEQVEDKAIVYAEYKQTYFDEDDQRLHSVTGQIARFKPGEVLSGTGKAKLSVEVIAQTQKTPYSMDYVSYNTPVCIVSDSWMNSHREAMERYDRASVSVFLRCENADETEELVRRDMGLGSYTVTNYAHSYEAERNMYLVIAIFLYGFITVVALIGVTNIFNTVTTNMELRAPEFAMLKAVGMTDREFERMIWLEGLFYGGKALIIALPLGVALSFLFHRALGVGVVMRFRWPIEGIVLSVTAVFLLLHGIMRYSVGRLKQKNLIQTIQNENI